MVVLLLVLPHVCTYVGALAPRTLAPKLIGVDLLLAKVSTAERAERACATTLRPGSATCLPLRSQPAEVLLVLSSVRTARDLLALRCDVPTVVAAMLSQAITTRAPAGSRQTADRHRCATNTADRASGRVWSVHTWHAAPSSCACCFPHLVIHAAYHTHRHSCGVLEHSTSQVL
jgi:hypothetical protein